MQRNFDDIIREMNVTIGQGVRQMTSANAPHPRKSIEDRLADRLNDERADVEVDRRYRRARQLDFLRTLPEKTIIAFEKVMPSSTLDEHPLLSYVAIKISDRWWLSGMSTRHRVLTHNELVVFLVGFTEPVDFLRILGLDDKVSYHKYVDETSID